MCFINLLNIGPMDGFNEADGFGTYTSFPSGATYFGPFVNGAMDTSGNTLIKRSTDNGRHILTHNIIVHYLVSNDNGRPRA